MIVSGNSDWIGPWVFGKTGGKWNGEGQTIGLTNSDEGLSAGVVFDNFNGANVNMHVASDGSRRWLNREFLWYCFYYPFKELKVKRVTGLVAEPNKDSRRFTEHIGFTLEARLKDAHPEGDMLVYAMTPDQCRWLSFKGKHHG